MARSNHYGVLHFFWRGKEACGMQLQICTKLRDALTRENQNHCGVLHLFWRGKEVCGMQLQICMELRDALTRENQIYLYSLFSLRGCCYSMWSGTSHWLGIHLERKPYFSQIMGFGGFKLLMVKTIHFQRSSFLFFWYIVFILGCILQELLE